MTDEIMSFRQAVRKNPGADLLREMVCFPVQGAMVTEVAGRVDGGENPARTRNSS